MLRYSTISSFLPVLHIAICLFSYFSLQSYILLGLWNLQVTFIGTLLLGNALIAFRYVARQIVRSYHEVGKRNILVYGTSELSVDLVNALAFGKKYNVVGFVQDMSRRSSHTLAGLPIYSTRYSFKHCRRKKY